MEAKLMQPGGRRYPKAGKKLIPPKLNLNQKSRKRSQHDDFDCRPFSFIENDPITPGFDPITPFEITPPHSPEGSEKDDDDDDDDVIIDSPAPFGMIEEEPEKNNDNEFISKKLGFTSGDFHKRSSFRDMSSLRRRSRMKRDTVFEDTRNSMVSEPYTPFDDEFEEDVKKPIGFAPVMRFVATEVVCPVPTHPTPLSPTMERFLARMQEVIQTPASAMFPQSAKIMEFPETATATATSSNSHVIDVNIHSVVGMAFSSQGMTDITSNQALVLQESDPFVETGGFTYVVPVTLNDAPKHCSCGEDALHPNNILRFENVIVQVRLAPRPRVKRHGWTFLNVGVPIKVAQRVLAGIDGVGSCRMVAHGAHLWIYTPVRAFTKIYRRRECESDFEEDEEDLYQELSDAHFYSLLDGRSLEVDLYAEVYAKTQTAGPISRVAEGDFSLGLSIREIVVTGEAVVRGPEWNASKSQRVSKCNARGHPEEKLQTVVSPAVRIETRVEVKEQKVQAAEPASAASRTKKWAKKLLK